MHSVARKSFSTTQNNAPLCLYPSLRPVHLRHSQRSAVRSCAFDGDRRTLLAGLMLGGLDSLFAPQMSKPMGLESLFNPFMSKPEAEVAPEFGNCVGCFGPGDLSNGGSLGACVLEGGTGEFAGCVSTYDDRPEHFYNSWEFDGRATRAADQLAAALDRLGAAVRREGASGDYIYASLPDRAEGGKGPGTVDLEFLFGEGDNTISVRAASRRRGDASTRPALTALLNGLRRELGFTDVPILRNRRRLFFIIESPFDSFGPEMPPEIDDYKKVELDLGRGID